MPTEWIFEPELCALSVYDKRVDAETLLECMARCQQETDFDCLTMDFHAGAAAGDSPACYLRSQNRSEVSADMEETEYCYTSEKRDNGTLNDIKAKQTSVAICRW